MESYLASLNEKQKEAVCETHGPVLIVAGAGAGKTKTITHRIFHLIKTGTSPSNILAITFTNKAAREMRERVLLLLNSDEATKKLASRGQLPFVSTFHALGVHIIRQNAQRLGLPRFFTIYDKGDAKRIIKEALVSLNYDPKQIDPGRIQGVISREKGNFVTAREYAERIGNEYFPKIVSSAWNFYEKALAREQALDLDDLLLVTAKFLASNEEAKKYYQELWRFIHIDEYQDTNKVQYEIARLLAEEHRNICVVGDTDQNIYSWRGADIKNMLRFEKDYSETKVVLLEENYRSTKRILAAAESVIKKNNLRIEKNLFTNNEKGQKIGLFCGLNEVHEAEFVAEKSEELLKSGVPADEIAVLYRANFQSRILEDAFFGRGVPYTMVGTKFFERKEIKDMLSFLRAALNPKSVADIKRVINIPARGIGPKTLEKIMAGEKISGAIEKKAAGFFSFLSKIKELVSQEKPSKIIKFIMKESGVEESLKLGSDEDRDRLENIMELVTLAAKYDGYPSEEGIERLLSDAALAGSEESPDENGEGGGVRLMTVHASKGLEFEYVFITGLEQDLFPHRKINESGINANEAEEERRLFYVALTRAKQKVFLSYAGYRTIFGERRTNAPSEFIYDISSTDVEQEFSQSSDFAPFDDTISKRNKERFIEF